MESFAYPQRNLPGRAEDWGRAVEAQQRNLSREVRQVSQAWENSARATGGQLAVISSQIDSIAEQQLELEAQQGELSAQQSDLVGRVSYFNSADASSTSFPSAGTYVISGSAVTFTLDRGRTVQVLATSSGYITSIIGPGTPTARLAVSRSGSLVGSVFSRGAMSSIGRSGFEGSIVTPALLDLPEGTHTLTPAIEFFKRQTGDGFICNNVSLTVNVLQPL